MSNEIETMAKAFRYAFGVDSINEDAVTAAINAGAELGKLERDNAKEIRRAVEILDVELAHMQHASVIIAITKYLVAMHMSDPEFERSDSQGLALAHCRAMLQSAEERMK